MNTNTIEKVGGSVNVTIHKNYFKQDDTNHARVQRTTAGMDNVIALVCDKSTLFDKASLVAAQMLFKEAVLELLQQGRAVNLFELGTLYPCAQGSINSANPSPTEIPPLTLGFTPAQVSLEAVSKANVSMSQVAQTHPVINLIEDLSTHRFDNSLTPAKPRLLEMQVPQASTLPRRMTRESLTRRKRTGSGLRMELFSRIRTPSSSSSCPTP